MILVSLTGGTATLASSPSSISVRVMANTLGISLSGSAGAEQLTITPASAITMLQAM